MFTLLYQEHLAWSICFAAMAAVVIGIAKSGFGGAIGLIAVPLMAAAMPTDKALGVLLPILMTGDAFSLLHHRRHVAWRPLRLLLLGAVVGLVGGVTVWMLLKDSAYMKPTLNIGIGALCLLLLTYQVVLSFMGRQMHGSSRASFGAGAGAVAAFVSTIAHSAGPVVALYVLAQKLSKSLTVGTMVVFFTLMNLSKLPFFIGLELINKETLLHNLWLVPLVPLGTVLGFWIHRHVPERPFLIVMYVGTAAGAANMLYKGLAG